MCKYTRRNSPVNGNYSKRHNKFLFLALAEAIYGSSCKAENEISNVVNYSSNIFLLYRVYRKNAVGIRPFLWYSVFVKSRELFMNKLLSMISNSSDSNVIKLSRTRLT